MIVWKSWNWPQYSRECLLNWIRWHLVVETSSLNVKKPKSASQYYPLWMWRDIRTRRQSCSSAPTDYVNSCGSGLGTHNPAITGHCSSHTMSGQLSSMSWKFYGHSSTGPCGCGSGIPLLCIRSSVSTMTCSITSLAWCELWPRRRQNWRKTYTLPWSLRGRRCPNIILKWPQRLVCFSFWNISLILSRSCDHLGSGTREWISILKTRLLILPNSRRPF